MLGAVTPGVVVLCQKCSTSDVTIPGQPSQRDGLGQNAIAQVRPERRLWNQIDPGLHEITDPIFQSGQLHQAQRRNHGEHEVDV